MSPVTIHQRSFQFSVDLIRLVRLAKWNDEVGIIRRQVIRSSTSIGANIIEAQQSGSRKQFLQMLQIALRSSRETEYLLQLSLALKLFEKDLTEKVLKENEEISKILTKILVSTKRNNNSENS